ncbi:DMT family transporter [Methylobacterium planeticum]|uniref:DMT family transporter n=1 Tax=Methylobacterium planeticum TaxID=2615211 RepID=A0A6N6MUD3_9HYPH|nr:DMT family transporter [Methylobacterium planeticum]KAB1074719.1 DMT family transporter [Methylobacterium planeticum]
MSTAPRPPAIASLVPSLFVVIWATGFIAARLVAPYSEPLTFVAARVVSVAAVLAVIAWIAGARWPRDALGWRNALVAGVLMQGLYVLGVFWSVHRGLPAGIAALVGSLQPLLTAMLARPLLGEFVSRRRWLGIGIGFVGAGLVLAPKIGAADTSGIPPLALAACLGAMAAMTLGTLWQKRTSAAADLLTNATVQFVGAAALAVPLALLAEEGRVTPALPLAFGMAWSVFVNSVAGILLLLWLIRRGAVAGVASLLFLVPPVSAAMAYLLFGEALTPIQIAGMAVATAGVAIANRG